VEVTLVLENTDNASNPEGSNNENLYTFTEIITLPVQHQLNINDSGSVLIVTIWVVLVLTGLTLVFCRP